MESTVYKDKKILIVDDYAVNTELLSIFVSDVGANALTASNGKECVELIKREHVDMILMDKNMPIMDGIAATRAVRNLQQGKDVIIVGITGIDEKHEIDECINCGMNMVCVKLELNQQKLLEIGERYFGHVPTDIKVEQHNNSSSEIQVSEADPEIPVMNYSKALKEFENDTELLQSLIKDFTNICYSKIDKMRDALLSHDIAYIQTESHGIKGGAANLCAHPLSVAASQLEIACKQNADTDLIGCLVKNLASCLDTFSTFTRDECN